MADPDKVTIYEVARRAGVSIAIVSHVFNRPERVKSSTRERVLDVVDELGFVPKPTAVSLARKGVGRIGVLAPFTSYSSYATRLNGIFEACAGRAVEVVVFDAPSGHHGRVPAAADAADDRKAGRPGDHGSAAGRPDSRPPQAREASHRARRQPAPRVRLRDR